MSAVGPVVVAARWRVREPDLETVLGLLDELRPQALAEPGCLGYDVYQQRSQPSELLLLERYRDDAALLAHRRSKPYAELVVRRTLPLLSDRQVEILSVHDIPT